MPPVRPLLVALSATTETAGGHTRVRLNRPYVDAIERAGLIPLIAPPLAPDAARALIQRVDGLVLTGGEDVDARLYGQASHPRSDPPNAARDRWETALAHAARSRRLPTLAICRGVQIVNVAFGGTLLQDIPSQRPDALPHTRDAERRARVHDVALAPGSALRRALGADRIGVNSMHHQSVDRPGEGLRATGHAADGIVEGVEWGDGDWWMLGVQWHPEELDQTPEDWDRTLFGAFAAAVRSSTANAPRRAPGA